MAFEPEQNFHIEEKVLEFEVQLLDAQFNTPGRYFLKFSVQSLATKDYTKVQLKKNAAAEYIIDSEFISDVVTIEDATRNCVFQEKNFTFKLPKGFLKNDKNHDVFMLVEAFTVPEDTEKMGTKVGEGKVAIYPRTNAPRINISVDRGDNMYRFTDIMTIRRTLSSDELKMHCGRLKCVFALREDVPPSPPTPEPPPVKSPDLSEFLKEPPPAATLSQTPPREETPPPPAASTHQPPEPRPQTHSVTPPSSWQATPTPQPLHTARTPTPPPPRREGQLLESPLPRDQRAWYSPHPGSHHVARHGKERVDVLVHGAISLPSPSDGSVPQPYVVVKCQRDEGSGSPVPGRTHASLHPTHTPLWEELVSAEVEESIADEETLVLSVGEKENREALVTYRIPLAYLKPYHQYHLELVMPSANSPYGTRTYVTVTRKTGRLLRDPDSPNYCALEVLLCGAEKSLANPMGPLIAVARVVPDGPIYRDDNLTMIPRAAGVTLTTVTCPSPHPSSFAVPTSQSQGYPQITLHGYPETQPVWNHHFLFSEQREKATLFTPSAALFIEYYTVNEVVSDMVWRLRSPVGFSTLLLNENVYKQLAADRGRLGVRVEGLPIQGSSLLTTTNEIPTVGLILRLLATERPDTLASASDTESLPVLRVGPPGKDSPEHPAEYYRDEPSQVLFVNQNPEAAQTEETPPLPESPQPGPSDYPPPPIPSQSPRLYKQRVLKKPILPIKEGELPPFDAMESVLPEYQYIFVDPNQSGRPPADAQPVTQRSDVNELPPSVLDHQLKELQNYRTAVHKMGADILALREQIRALETENSRLRRDLTHYDDNTRLILDSSDLDDIPRTELASRYASLKQKLASQTSDLKSYKDKVHTLQNEIIKKNDREKELQKVREAHVSQQNLLQRFQEKAKKVNSLEEACRKQEKVIEKMERLLQKQQGHKNPENLQADTQDALLSENRRLRQEMESVKDQLRNKATPRPNNSETEKLELYQALDKAEGRIMSLEKQLAENSRAWGRERAELALRITEAEHGFGRPPVSPSPAPLRYSFPATKEPRRYSKAPTRSKYMPKLGTYY